MLDTAKSVRKGSLTCNLSNWIQILSAITLLHTPRQRNLSEYLVFHIKVELLTSIPESCVQRLRKRMNSRWTSTMTKVLCSVFYADFLPLEEIKYEGRRFGMYIWAPLKSKLWPWLPLPSFGAHPLHSDDSLLLIINSVGTNTLPQNNGHLVSLQYPFISDKELRPMRRNNIPTTGLWQPDP